MQTVLSYLGLFRTLTHTQNSNPSCGLSFSLSGKQMPLFVLPAPCWGFEKKKKAAAAQTQERQGAGNACMGLIMTG